MPRGGVVTAAVQALIRPEPKRDRFGRYVINGTPYTRATTYAKSLEDMFNLSAWMQRQVAMGLAKRPDLLARAASTRPEERKQLDKICDDAREAAAASSGANLGTARQYGNPIRATALNPLRGGWCTEDFRPRCSRGPAAT